MPKHTKQKSKKSNQKPHKTTRPTYDQIREYCITNGIVNDKALKKANEDLWYELVKNSWSRPNYWEAVQIILGKRPLPEHYQYGVSSLYLDPDDLTNLGTHFIKSPENGE